ncbi:MAG: fused MFS/spermidine synthase, partial [Nitrospira sp.]|nr:fused MFS/spermidine synthase [Nitrospira sp.]
MSWIGGIILLCFFLSGASGLIYEVVWLRMLVLVFGSTTLAVSTVLTAFMGGLALGSLWFGRVVDRWRRPLYTYGLLEGCIGLYGLLVPLLFPLLVPLYQVLWDLFHPSFYLFNLLRFLLAMVVLIIPTTLMGATLPVLASYYAGRKEHSARRIGLLYTFNTAGAVMGTFATGFILLPSLGIQKTTWIAAALNLFLSLTVIWISGQKSQLIGPSMMRTDRDPSYEGLEKTDPSCAALAFKSQQSQQVAGVMTIGLALVAFAFSGYTALVYEVAWTRVLSLILGSSIYAFSTMLTTFLLGLALGSALFTQILNRLKWPIQTFALVQIGIALTCYATSALLERLPYFFLWALAWGLPVFQDHPDRLIIALWFFTTAVVMILPTLLFGGTFPLVIKIYHLYAHKMGRTAGDVYSVNTVGAILGAFLGGFVLIPTFGLQWTLL